MMTRRYRFTATVYFDKVARDRFVRDTQGHEVSCTVELDADARARFAVTYELIQRAVRETLPAHFHGQSCNVFKPRLTTARVRLYADDAESE